MDDIYMNCSKVSISSDLPSYFLLGYSDIVNRPVTCKGKRPRPLHTTRLSKENPFSSMNQTSILKPKFIFPHQPLVVYKRTPAIKPTITSQLSEKMKITRNDADTIKQLTMKIGNNQACIQSKNESKKRIQSARTRPHYQAYKGLSNPLAGSVSSYRVIQDDKKKMKKVKGEI